MTTFHKLSTFTLYTLFGSRFCKQVQTGPTTWECTCPDPEETP
jgi:hypothetical protein